MKKITSNERALELMIDEFDGSLSAEDKAELQLWVDADEDNRKTYHEYHKIKNTLDIFTVYNELDENTSWEALDKKISENTRVVAIRKTNPLIKWLSVAAAFIAVIGSVFYLKITANVVTLSTAANEHKTVNLPDGSTVVMNANTTIKYNSADYARNRELDMVKGEAFFDVVHNPENIFRISLGDLRATDIGTSFVVKRSDAETSVSVNTGKVAFEHLSSGSRVILDHGKKGIYLTGSKNIMNTANEDANYMSWINKKLTFSYTPMAEVARVLEKTYGSPVVVKDSSIGKRTFSGSMNYQTADSALNVISATIQVGFHKSGNKYIIE